MHLKISDKYSHHINNKSHDITKEANNIFIKPEQGQSNPEISRVKRATVVGNPMFSSNVDDGNNDEESLSLDDLDMDYEQIMHYFDNLKVKFKQTNFKCLLANTVIFVPYESKLYTLKQIVSKNYIVLSKM